jgi:hypothetical protein
MQTGLKFSGYPTPADSHFLSGSSIAIGAFQRSLEALREKAKHIKELAGPALQHASEKWSRATPAQKYQVLSEVSLYACMLLNSVLDKK